MLSTMSKGEDKDEKLLNSLTYDARTSYQTWKQLFMHYLGQKGFLKYLTKKPVLIAHEQMYSLIDNYKPAHMMRVLLNTNFADITKIGNELSNELKIIPTAVDKEIKEHKLTTFMKEYNNAKAGSIKTYHAL